MPSPATGEPAARGESYGDSLSVDWQQPCHEISSDILDLFEYQKHNIPWLLMLTSRTNCSSITIQVLQNMHF